MKVALAQINTTVGDLAGNEAKILAAYQRGVEAGVELVIFPELTITGYPPRDLLLKKSFVAQNLEVLDRLAAATGKTAMLVGYVGRNEKQPGRDRHELRRAAAERKNCRDARRRLCCRLTMSLMKIVISSRPRKMRRWVSVAENLGLTDLRRHLERRRFLAGTPLSAQSAGGTALAPGAQDLVQCFGVALARREKQDALRNAASMAQKAETPGGVLQSGRRE